MSRPEESWAQLCAKTQALLVEFLIADLGLASTFGQTAQLTAENDQKRCLEALSNARRALEVIRRLSERVDNLCQREDIQKRAAALELDLQLTFGVSHFSSEPSRLSRLCAGVREREPFGET